MQAAFDFAGPELRKQAKFGKASLRPRAAFVAPVCAAPAEPQVWSLVGHQRF